MFASLTHPKRECEIRFETWMGNNYTITKEGKEEKEKRKEEKKERLRIGESHISGGKKVLLYFSASSLRIRTAGPINRKQVIKIADYLEGD